MRSRRILSLDGGGSHLLIQLSVMACLEEDLDTSTFDFFDMIAGSSSGGLIACLILGRSLSAEDLIYMVLQEKLIEKIMAKRWMDRFLHVLQILPKYRGISKSLALQKELEDLKLSSLSKRIFIPCFNLDTDRLETFTNDSKPDFLLSEVADACTAAPAYYPPVRMQDGAWRIDGGIGMNNPGLGAYFDAQNYWEASQIKMLSIGSGWRSFQVNGAKACRYGGIQWSAKGIASMILREKMISNVKITESVLGNQILYINQYLKNYDMPDDMDSANNPVFQQKALDIGKQWYEHHQSRIQQWLQSQQNNVPLL